MASLGGTIFFIVLLNLVHEYYQSDLSRLTGYAKAAHSIFVPKSVLQTQLKKKDKKYLLLILHERLSNLHAFFIGNFSNKFPLLNKKRIFQML